MIRCIQWLQRTNFTATDCTRMLHGVTLRHITDAGIIPGVHRNLNVSFNTTTAGHDNAQLKNVENLFTDVLAGCRFNRDLFLKLGYTRRGTEFPGQNAMHVYNEKLLEELNWCRQLVEMTYMYVLHASLWISTEVFACMGIERRVTIFLLSNRPDFLVNDVEQCPESWRRTLGVDVEAVIFLFLTLVTMATSTLTFKNGAFRQHADPAFTDWKRTGVLYDVSLGEWCVPIPGHGRWHLQCVLVTAADILITWQLSTDYSWREYVHPSMNTDGDFLAVRSGSRERGRSTTSRSWKREWGDGKTFFEFLSFSFVCLLQRVVADLLRHFMVHPFVVVAPDQNIVTEKFQMSVYSISHWRSWLKKKKLMVVDLRNAKLNKLSFRFTTYTVNSDLLHTL